MTDYRRRLFFKFIDNRQDLFPLCSMLDKHPRCDVVLKWLVDNRYTGNTFAEWFKFKFAPDYRKMIAYVLAQRRGGLMIVK